MKLDDITIPPQDVNWNECLQSWNWLLHSCPEFSIFLITKFGEFIVKDDAGAIWFLSTSGADFEKIANSEEEFFVYLDEEDNFDFHFMPQVIKKLEASGVVLEKNECYSFVIPAVFEECTFEPSNFRVTDAYSYIKELGFFLGNLQQTPVGEKVEIKLVP